MSDISDDYMRANLSKTKPYTVMILRATEKRRQPEAEAIIWEHGRRNFKLRSEGIMNIICPVTDKSGIAGFGIFNADPEQVKKIYDDDPAVKAGVLTYELHPVISFPGDSLGNDLF